MLSQLRMAKLYQFVTVTQEQELVVLSEVGWLKSDMLVLTINNDFYLVNLN